MQDRQRQLIIKVAVVDRPTIFAMLVMVFFILFRIRYGKVKATLKLGLAIRDKIGLLLKTPAGSSDDAEQDT